MNPLRRLKLLPWLKLFAVSALTALIVAFLDCLLTFATEQSFVISRTLYFLYTPPLGLLIVIATAVGVGAMAVYLLEWLYQKVIINAASLWALVLCLAVCLSLKSLLPIPSVLVNLDQLQFVGLLLGIFWKGRPYWRYKI